MGISELSSQSSVECCRQSVSTYALTTASKTTGLRYWMLRVLHECDHVAADFSADPVHDLRVALRRCRSMADGMMAMDPEPDWKAMKKAGKRLFQQLGALRDTQIMMEWIEKLDLIDLGPVKSEVAADGATVADGRDPSASEANSTAGEPSVELLHSPAHILLHILKSRETDQKHEARAALEEFDRKQWRQWSRSLPQRASHIRPGSAVFKHLALERWTSARELHRRALRNRSQVAFHTLRIGIKRFRYIVENFLPAEHKAWSDDLKHMQDLLGEVHDLDVLWATALSCHVFASAASRNAWHEEILQERTQRIEEYRQKTVGENSLWNTWRRGLPQGKQIHEIATRRMKLWAKALDPDFAHSERVARLALELYDGLVAAGLLNGSSAVNGASNNARASLFAAALLHDVGKSKKNKGHHKESLELIQKHGAPLGWSSENLQRASIVARFHCGALPSRSHKALRDLMPEEQKTIIALAAVLRLANALDSAHDGHVRRVKIENGNANSSHAGRRANGFLRRPVLAKNEAIVIAAEGYSPGSPTAQAVAAERYLLETVLRRPIVVRQAASPQRARSDVRLAS
jgi:CHAD domain-containing protein/HD superfamily phosphodiesterase